MLFMGGLFSLPLLVLKGRAGWQAERRPGPGPPSPTREIRQSAISDPVSIARGGRRRNGAREPPALPRAFLQGHRRVGSRGAPRPIACAGSPSARSSPASARNRKAGNAVQAGTDLQPRLTRGVNHPKDLSAACPLCSCLRISCPLIDCDNQANQNQIRDIARAFSIGICSRSKAWHRACASHSVGRHNGGPSHASFLPGPDRHHFRTPHARLLRRRKQPCWTGRRDGFRPNQRAGGGGGFFGPDGCDARDSGREPGSAY